jgi:hypothetical protein
MATGRSNIFLLAYGIPDAQHCDAHGAKAGYESSRAERKIVVQSLA